MVPSHVVRKPWTPALNLITKLSSLMWMALSTHRHDVGMSELSHEEYKMSKWQRSDEATNVHVWKSFYLVSLSCWSRLSSESKSLIWILSSPSWKVLNEYFHNVCELDLVFNFYKVRTVEILVFFFIYLSLFFLFLGVSGYSTKCSWRPVLHSP